VGLDTGPHPDHVDAAHNSPPDRRTLDGVKKRGGRRAAGPAERLRDPDPFGGRPPIEQIDIGSKTFVTAKVQPLDVTGVRTLAVGAVLWAIAFFALLPFYPTLQKHDHGWWLWTCSAGFGLGLLGLDYCRRRRNRLAAEPEQEPETSPLGAAGL
jgi:Protein of unknown function (DUF2530)